MKEPPRQRVVLQQTTGRWLLPALAFCVAGAGCLGKVSGSGPDDCPPIEALFADNGCVGCHDATPGVEGGGLDLLSKDVSLRLVNQTSKNSRCGNEQLLINPESPGDSLLLRLIDPVRYRAWEDPCMPMMPFGSMGLAEDQVACVESWIDSVVDGSAPPQVTPFDPSPPSAVLAKVKYLLHGGAVTEAELARVTAPDGTVDVDELRAIVAGWTATAAFSRKLEGFLNLSLQQKDVNPDRDFRLQLRTQAGASAVMDEAAVFANLRASFVRTAMDIVLSGGDFRTVATTRRWQVTTAVLAALAYMDRIGGRGEPRFDDLAHLQASDYRDWRYVTLTQAGRDGGPVFENTAEFVASLRAIADGQSLALVAPRVGFMNTPAFFDNWQSNTDNQFRITTNQSLIAALDITFEAGDLTEQANLNGLNESHAEPGSACYQCHRLLDPMRLVFRNVYDAVSNRASAKDFAGAASFAFHGYATAIENMDGFAQALVEHPRFASAWLQKLCMWANSQRCSETDPEFVRLAASFDTHHDLLALIVDLFTSRLVTGHADSPTHREREYFVSVSRSNHLCQAVDIRVEQARVAQCETELAASPDSSPQICDTRLPSFCGANNARRNMASLISGDSSNRGEREFVQETFTGVFNARAYNEICTNAAASMVGPGATRPFTSDDPDLAIARMVELVMGLPPNHPRHDAAVDGLTRIYSIGRAQPSCSDVGMDIVADNIGRDGSGDNPFACGLQLAVRRSLYLAWIAACTSPEITGLGF